MPYAILLLFDAATDDAVREPWRGLDEDSLVARVPADVMPPHLTIGAYADLDPAAVERALVSLAATTAPLPLSLSQIGLFPSTRVVVPPEPVVFCAPTITRALLDLHTRIHDALLATGAAPLPYTAPDAWVPHCTLAYRFPPARTPAIVEALCARLALPLRCRVEALATFETSPGRLLCSHRLGGAGAR